MGKHKNEAENAPPSEKQSGGTMVSVLGMIGLQAGWEHVCDAFKVRKQVKPEMSYAHIARTMGVNGLKDGAIPNVIRTAAKNVYRTPMAMGSKQLYDALLPQETQEQHPNLSKDLGTVTMVAVEPFFATPAENLKTMQMTKKMSWRESVSATLQQGQFRGGSATALRQWGYWGTTLGVNKALQGYLQKSELSPDERLVSSTISGIGYTALSMPLDVAKTQMQKYDSPYTSMGKVFAGMKDNIKKNGIKAAAKPMAAGFVARAALASGSSFAATYVLDKGMNASQQDKEARTR